MKLCSISVDLDEIPNYFAIHGLGARAPLAEPTATAVYDIALPRLCELAGSLGVPLTLFAIGDDLARAESADRRSRCGTRPRPGTRSAIIRARITTTSRDGPARRSAIKSAARRT
jgi:hypothetical protein